MNDKVVQNIKKIAKNYQSIEKVILFGSRARGDYRTSSDYDIAVFANQFTDQKRFEDEIIELDTLYKIDLVCIDKHTSAELLENINREGVIIMVRKSKMENYISAVGRLKESLDKYDRDPDATVRDGAIQRFEFTAELAWKACREYLLNMGYNINGPKPTMKEAFAYGLVDNSETWIDILNDRNVTSHVYDDHTADGVFNQIKTEYYTEFKKLAQKFEELK